ncbi:PHP domain-containing protein, partial [bacterium]|nr:PHP domain-containing protein [bacterium]
MDNKTFIEEIKNYNQTDFENNTVNLHIHTTFSDGKAEAFDILKQAKEKGYKKIAICDHNTLDAHKAIKDEILIPAVEFDVWSGYVFCHLL